MEEYRKKLNEQCTTDVMPAQAIAPPAKTTLGYVNLGLPSRLTLDSDDENGLNWAQANSGLDTDTQSVDQEYSAYAFGALTKLDVDILKFWEVRDPSIC
jgi:hypothetical protein